MRANPSLLSPPPTSTTRLDRQAFLNAARRSTDPALLSSPKEEPVRSSLQEYAAFVLEQEARYCQQ